MPQNGVEGEPCRVLIRASGFHIVFLGLLQSKPERGDQLYAFLSVFLAEGEALKPFLVPIPKPSLHSLWMRVQERLKITHLCGGSREVWEQGFRVSR